MTSPNIERPMLNGRFLSLCDSCLVVDNHPKHTYGTSGREGDRVTYTADASATAYGNAKTAEDFMVLALDLADDATQRKHFDCCLADGCPNAGQDTGCDTKLADPEDPFDGGQTTGEPLIQKYEERVAALTAAMTQEA